MEAKVEVHNDKYPDSTSLDQFAVMEILFWLTCSFSDLIKHLGPFAGPRTWMPWEIMSDNVAIYPMNVLNVDGFGPECHIHTGFMRALGFNVQEVGNCSDALYLLQSQAKFDVIVFNMDMPNVPMVARFLRDVGIQSKLVGFTWDERSIRTFLHDSLNYCILKPSEICTIDAVLMRIADDYDDDE